MRNLYLRLGISPSASEREIRDAISRCRTPRLASDASEVLLIPGRRRNYDRVHRVLSDIGALRAHLGLNFGDNWPQPESDDFSSKLTHAPSLHDEFFVKVREVNRSYETERFGDSLRRFIVGVCLLVLAVLVIKALFFTEIPKPTASSVEYSTPPQTASTRSTTGNNPPSQPKKQTRNTTQPRQPVFNEPALPLPKTGTIRRYTIGENIAPFEVITRAGSNYLVRLEDFYTQNEILDVFVRGGTTMEIKVPLGTYILKYATGKKWYGYKHHFGPNTAYNKADTLLKFDKDAYYVRGHTIELYTSIIGGNLSTSHISPDEF